MRSKRVAVALFGLSSCHTAGCKALGEPLRHLGSTGDPAAHWLEREDAHRRQRGRGRRQAEPAWHWWRCRGGRAAAAIPDAVTWRREEAPEVASTPQCQEQEVLVAEAASPLFGLFTRGTSALAGLTGGGVEKPTDKAPAAAATAPSPAPVVASELPATQQRTRFVSECSLPTARGEFRLRAYRHDGPGKPLEPVVVISGDISSGADVPVRVHDQCLTGEVLGSRRCDCKAQLDMSLDYIKEHGGAVIYLQQEGRGIGLANKVAAYALQDRGLDTVDANRHLGFEDDERSYEAVDFIMRDLGITSVQLMTNNPYKIRCIEAMGVKVHRRIPMLTQSNEHNHNYLLAKARRMSHFLQMDGPAVRAAAAGVVSGAAVAAAAGGSSGAAATVAAAAAAGALTGAAEALNDKCCSSSGCSGCGSSGGGTSSGGSSGGGASSGGSSGGASSGGSSGGGGSDKHHKPKKQPATAAAGSSSSGGGSGGSGGGSSSRSAGASSKHHQRSTSSSSAGSSAAMAHGRGAASAIRGGDGSVEVRTAPLPAFSSSSSSVSDVGFGAAVNEASEEGEHALDDDQAAAGLLPNPGYTELFGRASAEAAVAAVKEGRAVVVVDDEDRENEGDLIFAAEAATPELLAFTIRHSSGVICVAMEEERLEALGLPQMVPENQDPKKTAFAITVDSRYGVSTGISAGDRSRTIRQLADPGSVAEDFNRPGHIFPLRCRAGGVLERPGHTEAAVDLCRLAGMSPVGVLCELTTADGADMARAPELLAFAERFGMVVTSIQDLRQFIGSGDWREAAAAAQVHAAEAAARAAQQESSTNYGA